MPKPESIREYIGAVTEQIRWKRAREAVAWELRQHLEEQRDDFAAGGHADAEQLAVREMGDPVSVGEELDRIHRPKPQWGLLALTVLLAAAGGILRVWLTGYGTVTAIAAVILGTAALLAGYLLDCSRLFRYAGAVYFAALAAGIAVLYLGPTVNHASVYTNYIVQFYPIIYLLWLYRCRGQGWKGFFLAAAGGIPLTFVCLEIPSLLGALILLLTGFLLLCSAVRMDWFQIPKRTAAALLSGAVIFAGGVLIFQIIPSQRFQIALHPEADPNQGYTGIAVRNTLQASQWFGAGSDEMLLPLINHPFWEELPPIGRYLPDWDHNLLLTTLIYKLGWLPFLLLAASAAVLVLRMLWKCLRQSSQTGRMLAMAVALNLGLRMLGSIALNMGFVLFSAEFPLVIGNLRSVADMFMIGLALSAFRGDTVPPVPSREGRLKAG